MVAGNTSLYRLTPANDVVLTAPTSGFRIPSLPSAGAIGTLCSVAFESLPGCVHDLRPQRVSPISLPSLNHFTIPFSFTTHFAPSQSMSCCFSITEPWPWTWP